MENRIKSKDFNREFEIIKKLQKITKLYNITITK